MSGENWKLTFFFFLRKINSGVIGVQFLEENDLAHNFNINAGY